MLEKDARFAREVNRCPARPPPKNLFEIHGFHSHNSRSLGF
jgi:hypothetical protein